VNGKRYVRHARDLLVAAGLFRQNVIRYRPLLEHGLEAFVLVPSGTLALVGALGRVCPVVEEARAADGRVLLRLTGDERFVYEWLRLTRESVGPFGVWLHDYRRKGEELRRARFQYEVLFDPVSGTWRFPVDEMLSSLRRAA
jgi:Lon protease-like protein